MKTPRLFLICSLKKLFFIATIFLASCSVHQEDAQPQPIDITKEEHLWLEKFISDFFFSESTIYTLLGSKPMSEIPLCCAKKKEWLAGYSNLIKDYPEKKKQIALSNLEKYIDNYDLPLNWNRWISWSAKNLDRSFLFAKRMTDSKNLFSIYVLNIQEAAWILEKNYSLISHELDMKFDPLQVVLEFDDLSSPFWEKVFSNHFVQGILYGYGKRNSYFFDRKMNLQEKNAFNLYTHPLFKSALDKKDDPKELPLPHFRSFSSDLAQDPIYKKFKKEQKEINKILTKKNKFDLILNKLGYRPNKNRGEIAFN